MARRGRPREGADDPPLIAAAAARRARAFGKLMEAELAKGEKVESAMAAIHRRNPRWGSRSKMFALWSAYKVGKARKAQRDQDQKRLLDEAHAALQRLGPWNRAKAEAAIFAGGRGIPRWKLYARSIAILLQNRFFWTRP
jgi:hypothetical protein